MASHISQKPKQFQVMSEIDSRVDQLRRELHPCLDLNHPILNPTPTQLRNQSLICNDTEMVERGCPMQDGDDEKYRNDLDLNLALTLPGQDSSKDESPKDQSQVPSSSSSSSSSSLSSSSSSSNSSSLSSPSSQRSCMSLDLNIVDNQELDRESTNKKDEDNLPSLILMGCTHCIMYVMVSEADPKCPKCQTSILLDVFRDKPAKRSRIN